VYLQPKFLPFIEKSLYGFQINNGKLRVSTKHNILIWQLRCICWLNQKLVLQHVNLLNAQKTLFSTDGILFGAGKPKSNATSQNVHIQCAWKGACCLAEFAVRPSNARPLRKMSTTSSMIQWNLKGKLYANLETRTSFKIKTKTKIARVKTRVSIFYFDLTRFTTGGLTFFKILYPQMMHLVSPPRSSSSSEGTLEPHLMHS